VPAALQRGAVAAQASIATAPSANKQSPAVSPSAAKGWALCSSTNKQQVAGLATSSTGRKLRAEGPCFRKI
jgi:hypothetical protein